jgi:hypothetical protein
MMARASRLVLGALAAWPVAVAIAAPELWPAAAGLSLGLFALTLWRTAAGLLVLSAVAPAGALLASTPARTAELLAWATLAGWLLAIWRPLAPSGWARAVVVPALLLGAAAAASWLGLSIAGAAGVASGWLPVFLWRLIPSDVFVFSTPDPETRAMLQMLTGLGVLLAAVATSRHDAWLARGLPAALIGALGVLAAATLVQIGREWAANGFTTWLVDRFVFDLAASRFSVHLRDNNAAGSLYALGAVAGVAMAVFDRRHRWRWSALVLVILPAFWVTGSRTAVLAAVLSAIGMAALWGARDWGRTERRLLAAGGAAVVIAAAVVWGWQQDQRMGSPSEAVSMRWQFTQTSARMFASAPILGVGVGRYHGRSGEFMPDTLREVYPNENAHNYFAQEFAELGLVGGALFLWLVLAGLNSGWARARETGGAEPAALALLAGCATFILTCATGHPLLVSEAALPFWVAFGAVASVAPSSPPAAASRVIVSSVLVLLAAGVALSGRAYADATARPQVSGFYERDVADDGTPFFWTTRHVTTYGGPTPGFIRLVVRAPDRPSRRPFVVETWLGGHVVDRAEVASGQWLVREIPVRSRSALPLRRIDVRVNQAWTRPSDNRNAPETPALALMAAEIRWAGPGSR